jgi:hypothetical protein
LYFWFSRVEALDPMGGGSGYSTVRGRSAEATRLQMAKPFPVDLDLEIQPPGAADNGEQGERVTHSLRSRGGLVKVGSPDLSVGRLSQ